MNQFCVVRQGFKLNASFRKFLIGFLQLVGEDSNHTKNIRSFTLGSCDSIQDRSTSRNQIFHYDHLLTLWYTAFNLITSTVVFWFATDVGKWQIHLVRNNSTMRNPRSCCTCNHFNFWEGFLDFVHEAILNQSTSFWISEGHAIIRINRGLDPRRPRKRLFRFQINGFNF